MEVEATDDHLSDLHGETGTCLACLYEEELDADGLCAGCNPISEDTRVALINLLKPKPSNEVKTSENN
jgi:hypothetical protein